MATNAELLAAVLETISVRLSSIEGQTTRVAQIETEIALIRQAMTTEVESKKTAREMIAPAAKQLLIALAGAVTAYVAMTYGG